MAFCRIRSRWRNCSWRNWGFIAGATGHLDEARIYGGIAGYLAGVTLSTLAMKQALQGNLARLVAASQAPDY